MIAAQTDPLASVSDGFRIPSRSSDAVVDHLGRAIAEGRLIAGSRLVETELAAALGVSRTPVREAISILAAEGLVTISPRRGARVADLTPKSVSDVFTVRAALEGLGARLAIGHCSRSDAAKLRTLNESMRRDVKENQGKLFFDLNEQFHRGVATLAGNEYLASLQQTAATRSFRPLFLNLSNLDHFAASVDDHAALLEALLHRDAEAADRVMQAHILAAQQEALRLVHDFSRRSSEAQHFDAA